MDQGRDTQIEQACEVMHDAYEKAAVGAGWETQQASRKPWDDVPEANKTTMRAAVSALLDHLALNNPLDVSGVLVEGGTHLPSAGSGEDQQVLDLINFLEWLDADQRLLKGESDEDKRTWEQVAKQYLQSRMA